MALYLSRFVAPGWIPHDEGFLGATAERVMGGDLPHLAYLEGYSGGLSFFHAAVFRIFGVDLVWLRWALWLGATLALGGVLFLARTFASPASAALVAALALTWSFPCYFVAIPSWWNLILGIGTVVALVALQRVRRRRSLLLVAGLFVGMSLSVKVAALYVLVGSVMAILYVHQASCPVGHRRALGTGALLRLCVAGGAVAMASVVLSGRSSAANLVTLLLPCVTVSTVLVTDAWRRELPQPTKELGDLASFGLGVVLPLVLLAAPYMVVGRTTEALANWWSAVTSFTGSVFYEQPDLWLLGSGAGLLTLVVSVARPGSSRRTKALAWTVAALSVLAWHTFTGYQLIFQSVRLMGIGGPVVGSYLVWRRAAAPESARTTVFTLAAVTAFWGLVQYPFSAAVYFLYTAPLVWLLAAALTSLGRGRWNPAPLPIVALYLIFAVLSLNRSQPAALGLLHRPVNWDTPLAVPKGSLRVRREDAEVYQRLVRAVSDHATDEYVYAAPDCPEVYFLTGKRNPTEVYFDFLRPSSDELAQRLLADRAINLVVINHRPSFSPDPSEAFLRFVRDRFEHAEVIGKFEVRWTDMPVGQRSR
jgi:hypothetical protein